MQNPKHPPPRQSQTASAVAAATQPLLQQVVTTTQVQQYSGQIPPPDLLRGFDDLLPGTAARLLQWADDEQMHRRRLESDAQAANIDAQRRQFSIADYQSKGVFRSDMVGCALDPCGPANLWQVEDAATPKIASVSAGSRAVPPQNLS